MIDVEGIRDAYQQIVSSELRVCLMLSTMVVQRGDLVSIKRIKMYN